MRLIYAWWPCALLVACTPPKAERTPAAAPSEFVPAVGQTVAAPASVPSPTLAQVTSLAGEWRVAGIDGAELDEPYGLALSGSAQELWWEPRCALIVRSYRIAGSAIDFGPRLEAPKPGGPPPAVCAIAPPPRLADVTRALDAATTIGRTANNGVEISGGGHSLLLFGQ